MKNKDFSLPDNYFWYGDNGNKGVGIFAEKDYEIKIEHFHNPNYKYIIPIKINGKQNINIYAVWAMNDKIDKKQRYIGQVYNALKEYENKFDKETIIIGDFNWNKSIKATGKLYGNFEDVINILTKQNIVSAYHEIKKRKIWRRKTANIIF